MSVVKITHGRWAEKCVDNFGKLRPTLYVGASPNQFKMWDKLCHDDLCVVEIYKPYIEQIQRKWHPSNIICEDVYNAHKNNRIRELAPFQLIVWAHGPEHMQKNQAKDIIGPNGIFDLLCNGVILINCPLDQNEACMRKVGRDKNNPYEAHVSKWSEEDFKELNYETDPRGQEIIAWKYL